MAATMVIGKEFVFHAAHNLTGHYKGQCENLHGHSYRLKVAVEGPVQADGLVMDFVELGRIVQERVVSVLDHSYLNDIIGGSASLERIAEWVWSTLEGKLPLKRLELWETDSNFLVYDGPEGDR